MQKIIKQNSGVYILELIALKPFSISSKKFLANQFEKGYYYYSGSAQKNLQQRITRHLKKEKTIYWHIDYLTTHHDISIRNIYLLEGSQKETECEFISVLQKEFDLKIVVNGFGNGDCSICDSHLLYSVKKLNYNHFASRYQSIVRFIPSSNPTF